MSPTIINQEVGHVKTIFAYVSFFYKLCFLNINYLIKPGVSIVFYSL